MFGGFTDATAANIDVFFRRQHHIDHADLAQFVKNPSRFITQARSFGPLVQCFPEHIGQEADQDMRENPILFLMPDRPDLQVAFMNSKGRFGLGQLDVGLP